MPEKVRVGSGTTARATSGRQSSTPSTATVSDHVLYFQTMGDVSKAEKRRRLKVLKSIYAVTEKEVKILAHAYGKVNGPGVVNCFLRERERDKKACIHKHLEGCGKHFVS